MDIQKSKWKIFALSVIALAVTSLTACGGGGGGGSTSGGSNSPTSVTIINGLASKGPISGGTASVYSITNGQMGNLLATATTASDGTFTANIGAYNGLLMVQVTGGSYTDEATGKTLQMGSLMLRTAVGAAAGNVNVAVTPLTEAAVQYMNGNLTSNMILLANSLIATKFGMSDIVQTFPQNVLSGANASANSSQTYYGLTLAAMSQMAASNNISISTIMSDVATDLANTGPSGTQAFTILMNTMAQSFTTFETTNSNNKTGVTTMSPMMSRVSTGGATNGTMGGPTIVNGLAAQGPIANGNVSIYAITSGQISNLLASTTTGSSGAFLANLGSYNGPMMVQVTGGSYTDEATGKTIQMGSNMLRTAVSNAAGNVTVAVTPITEMAVQYMGGLTSQDMINLANNIMGSEFGISDIVGTLPANTNSGNTAANNAQTYYGLMLGAMSQAAAGNNISMSAMMSTIANALKDTSSTGSQTLTSMMTLMSQSFLNFESSTNNKSGVTTMKPGGMMSSLGGMMGGLTGDTGGSSNSTTGSMGGGMMGGLAGNSTGPSNSATGK